MLIFAKKANKLIVIDAVQYVHRNGHRYKQVSYFDEKGTRYSTLVDPEVPTPIDGEKIPRNTLIYTGKYL